MDKNDKKAAVNEFDALCAALEDRGWDFEKNKDDFSVGFTANGKDMPVEVTLKINPELMTVSAFAAPPVQTPEGMDEQLAVATVILNDGVIHGNFDYDKNGRRIIFRVSTSYRDTALDKEVYLYLIAAAFTSVDQTASTIKALCDGTLAVEQMIATLAR